MSDSINLKELAEPFPLEDIEWRVSRSGQSGKGIFCMVLAYITARAIQKRLDDVCGPAWWRNEEPRMLDVNGKAAFAVGISIRIGDEWMTKWDVAEPTNIEPAKGGFSGAMKRAGAQWGIGRYLYSLSETFADVAESQPQGGRNWTYARLSEKHGGGVFYWKAPSLPGWALPKEPEHEINETELKALKTEWRLKFAPDTKSPKDLLEGFTRFVHSICGEFPIEDVSCWVRGSWDECMKRIETTTDPSGVDADVPFKD